MPSLECRKIVKQHTCVTCKHCMPIRIAWESDWVYYCFMDLSKEDEDFMYAEVDEKSSGCIDEDADYSPRFVQIMMSGDDFFAPYHNKRRMEEDDCCQFYELDF